MSIELTSIVGLVLIFLLATLRSVNMGAVAFLGAFLLGRFALDRSEEDVFAAFPGDLFVVLVGVTLLFAIARSNGTVDWLIRAGVRAVHGRIALIPWVMFVVTALLTMVGAVVPGAVAMMAPVGLNFATRYRINPMLMGLLIINGASAGGFSPISIYGSVTNGVVDRSDLAGSPVLLWVSSLLFNTALSVVAFFLFGGRQLLRRRVATEPEPPRDEPATDSDDAPAEPGGTATATATRTGTASAVEVTTLDAQRIATLAGIALLAVGALALEFNVGLLALSIATVLILAWPDTTTRCVADVAWPTVLLVCGVVTYVGLMESVGTIAYLGDGVAGIGVPLLAAFVICLIGGGVSAFASTTGILGALIPLAVPFLQTGQVGAVGLIIALAISSSVVDSSPFSTSGALVVASSPQEARDQTFRGLMTWGMSMIVVAPVLAVGIFVLPGWL
ncbi:SLC13 family permease [Streptomyces mayteni]